MVPLFPTFLLNQMIYYGIIKEALANAERVISEWIEVAESDGREISEPQGRIMYAQFCYYSGNEG